MRAAGFVLTGGNSTRMGRDKALLPIGAVDLVEAVATTLSSVVRDVTLVGRPERYAHLSWPALSDLRPGMGPLAGLESALTYTAAELNLVVACDLPGLQQRWLATLLRHAALSEAPCVVTIDRAGQIHPLCAVYRVGCLPAIARALDGNRLKLMALIEELGADYLNTETTLTNMNTPLDWASWQLTHPQAD